MEEPFSSGKFPFKKAKNDVNSKEVINLMFFLSSIIMQFTAVGCVNICKITLCQWIQIDNIMENR